MFNNGKKHIFYPEEKKTFKDIVKRYSSVVELKDTDSETLKAKKHAWESIAKEYNASPHCTMKVSSKQLRRLWLNLRQRERQKESQIRSRQHQNSIASQIETLSDPLRNPDIAEEAPTLMVGIDEDQLHEFEMQVMTERLREARAKAREAEARAREAEAKADLAELVLAQHRLGIDNTICED